MTSEAEIQAEAITLLSALPGVRVFRNNVGSTKTESGGYLRYGLCVGSPDLIAVQSVLITPEMVGRRVALFRPVECKTKKGRESEAQVRFRNLMQSMGAFPVVWRSADSIRDFIAI